MGRKCAILFCFKNCPSLEIMASKLRNEITHNHFGRDNLIGAPRESRLKGASRDSKARVATQRRESRLKGASRDSKARVKKKYSIVRFFRKFNLSLLLSFIV